MGAGTCLAIAAGRLVAWGARTFQLGGGTALPGLVALAVRPMLLQELAERLPHGTIVVAGTNGKTTTARLIAELLHGSGYSVVHNRSGSNLPRGIASAFLERAALSGRLAGEIAVVEVDEFALPTVVRALAPRVLVLLNLFRDQLDRYGELETIARTWQNALQTLPAESLLVVNADDPVLTALTSRAGARRWTFGLDDPAIALPTLPHAADWRLCPQCSSELRYERVLLGHLGAYRCASCGFARPSSDVAGRAIRSVVPLRIEVTTDGRAFVLESRLAGVYNAYNLLAAATTGLALGLDPDRLAEQLARVEAAFGRQERVTVDSRELTLLLVKNPTGFNEAIRLLLAAGQHPPTLILVNDLDADGRDVSWLWDVDFELLTGLAAPVSAGGIRSGELALRLQYAGIEPAGRYSGVVEALDRWVATLPPGGRGWILATYTATLELRRELARRGLAPSFWEQ
ncbi:MAG: Mur ligase family protein [Thermomicrobium sp.]|nr:Mur ligase family protein [Thermomicrobium sp.]